LTGHTAWLRRRSNLLLANLMHGGNGLTQLGYEMKADRAGRGNSLEGFYLGLFVCGVRRCGGRRGA
jgi:hypothetical protein